LIIGCRNKKIKTIKYTGKAIVLSFESQFFKLWSAEKEIHIKDIWRRFAGASLSYTLTPQMFSINILCFMYNFSFKGDTLYRLIPSGGIDLFIPPDSLMGIQYHETPASNPEPF